MNPTDGAAAVDVSENGTLAYLPVYSHFTETDVVLVDRRGNATRQGSLGPTSSAWGATADARLWCLTSPLAVSCTALYHLPSRDTTGPPARLGA